MEVREGERGGERGMSLVPPSHTPLCTALGTPEVRVRPQNAALGCLCPSPSAAPGLCFDG